MTLTCDTGAAGLAIAKPGATSMAIAATASPAKPAALPARAGNRRVLNIMDPLGPNTKNKTNHTTNFGEPAQVSLWPGRTLCYASALVGCR